MALTYRVDVKPGRHVLCSSGGTQRAFSLSALGGVIRDKSLLGPGQMEGAEVSVIWSSGVASSLSRVLYDEELREVTIYFLVHNVRVGFILNKLLTAISFILNNSFFVV